MQQPARILLAGGLAAAAASLLLPSTALLPAAAARPADRRAAQIELGRRLFFDPGVSRTARVACSDCHDPEHGFSDSRIRSNDEHGLSPRHSQPLTDLGESGFHWDGEFDTLEEVVFARVGAPGEATLAEFKRRGARLEHLHDEKIPADLALLGESIARSGVTTGSYGSAPPAVTAGTFRGTGGFRSGPATGSGGPSTPSSASRTTPVRTRLERDGRYERGFRAAFGTRQVTTERIATAMSAYMRSLRTQQSAFDRFQAGDRSALSAQAQQGLELFEGKASCSSCHALDGPDGRPTLTDGKFHNTGVAFRRVHDEARRHDLALVQEAPSAALRKLRSDLDPGALRHSFRRDMTAHFKTPSLRDVARRAPYMHDGSLATLEEVVRYYDGGGTSNAHLDPEIAKLGLSDAEVAALVAFLESLSGDDRAGLGGLPPHRPDTHQVKVVDVQGKPIAQMDVTIHPCGDRLAGTDAMPGPFRVQTDGAGVATYPFPASTHVKLTTAGHELGTGRPVPDYTASIVLIASPVDAVSVRVRRRAKDKALPSLIHAHTAGPNGEPLGEPLVLRRKRAVGATEALYAMDRPTSRAGRAHMVLSGGNRRLGVFELDLDGGASEPIDVSVPATGPKLQKRIDKAAERIGKTAMAALQRNAREVQKAESLEK